MNFFFFLASVFVFAGSLAQSNPVDFTKIDALITPDTLTKQIYGEVEYTYLLNNRVDSIFIDARNLEVLELRLDGRKKTFFNNQKKIGFRPSRTIGEHKVWLRYTAKPKKALYFVGFQDDVKNNEQIWTQGQGQYTSHWLPSFDDMTEKVEVNLRIRMDSTFTVIANGKLTHTESKKTMKEWQFNMLQPMSSYLIAFVAGQYNKNIQISDSGVQIENYYYPKDSARVEPTYRYTKEIFDFLEREIGVPYPWQNYKQIPVHDFLYAGMENTGATLFSDAYLIDDTAFIDKNYTRVNAHELAHQWFGNLVTAQSGSHHWLQEGFATYYGYLAEKYVLGDDAYYWKLMQTANQLKHKSDEGNGQCLLDPKADSLTFYEKGAWALIMLNEFVGAETFKKGIVSYLETYSYKNATVAQFLTIMEKVSGKDLSHYKNEWLEATDFPFDEALRYLKKHSKSLAKYDMVQEAVSNSEQYFKDSVMTAVWQDSASIHLKKQFIVDYHQQISDAHLMSVLQNETLEVRQALALTRQPIFKNLKPLFESMLTDNSYITIENALYKLWTEFPEDRITYLEATKDIMGLPNKNVRLLWLTLAMVTPKYNVVKKASYLRELKLYTNPTYNPEVREAAFRYLVDVNLLEETALKNLLKATRHHSWQFRNFARGLLDQQLENEEFLKKIEAVTKDMDVKDLQYLEQKMRKV